MRYYCYEPDFVAVAEDGAHYLVQTQGREDTDVVHKDRGHAVVRKRYAVDGDGVAIHQGAAERFRVIAAG